jgi:hypothetical protein
VDPALDAFIRDSCAVPLDEFDLQVIQRVDVGQSMPQRLLQSGVVFQQLLLSGDRQQVPRRPFPLAADRREDGSAAAAVARQRRIAPADRQIGFRKHHFHV